MSQWKLEEFYPNYEVWEEDLNTLNRRLESLLSFKGKLSDKAILKDFLAYEKNTIELFYQLYAYAHLNADLDLKNNDLGGKYQQVMLSYHTLNQNTSWFAPEMLAMPKEQVMSWIDEDSELEEYRFVMEKMYHQQKHILSEESEKLLSNFQGVTSTPSSLYNALAVSDQEEVFVTLSNGDKIQVTSGNYRSLIADQKEAEDRKLIFEAFFQKYEKNKNTFAGIYNLVLQSNKAKYQSRGYSSALESFLFHNNIPTDVFMQLVHVANSNTEPLKRYIELRKKHLKIDKYRTYDRFLKLATSSKKYSYEEGKALFFDSLNGLDETFVEKQKEALADGYVDVFEKSGKRTGAYSSGVYGFHPYILLNYDNTLDSVFTLAHEAGHSAHTMFANETQPLTLADYTIFVAEIASTFNEQILLDYLLKKSESKEEKIALIEEAIDGIMSTFYRQTLFATYEYEANKLIEQGQPITEASLSKIMIDLYDKFYSIDIREEKGKSYVWAYIPHFFHTPFYVYQYATSYAASLKIYENVKNGDSEAITKLMNLLKSGGSEYPVDQAKKAGADLTDSSTFMAVVNRLNELIDILESLLDS